MKKPKASEDLMAETLSPPSPAFVVEEAPAPVAPTSDPLLNTARVVLGALLNRQSGLPDPERVAETALRYASALHVERAKWGA